MSDNKVPAIASKLTPAPAAARKRAQRRRERDGKIPLTIAVNEAALCTGLVDAGLIRPDQQDDRRILADVLARLVETILTADIDCHGVTPPRDRTC